MHKPPLTCVFFPDLLAWEREALAAMAQRLSPYALVDFVTVERGRGRAKEFARQLRDRHDSTFWCFAYDWQVALEWLPRQAKAFVSVLGPMSVRPTWPGLFWRKLVKPVGDRTHLIAHSQLSFRFLHEIGGIPEKSVSFLHLPFAESLPSMREATPRLESAPFTVVALARFSSENNLNFLLSVAHYVCRHKANARFRVLGGGALEAHLQEIVVGFDLQHQVSIEKLSSLSQLAHADALVYTPLRNEHFIPLHLAAAFQLPVLSTDIFGVEEFITDGRDGFVTPVNETKPMGELCLRLAEDPMLRASLAKSLASNLFTHFSEDRLLQAYARLFFGAEAMGEEEVSQVA